MQSLMHNNNYFEFIGFPIVYPRGFKPPAKRRLIEYAFCRLIHEGFTHIQVNSEINKKTGFDILAKLGVDLYGVKCTIRKDYIKFLPTSKKVKRRILCIPDRGKKVLHSKVKLWQVPQNYIKQWQEFKPEIEPRLLNLY